MVTLEGDEIPPESRRVAHKLIGRNLEKDDDAGFVEETGAAIDELGAQRRLPGADPAFQENDIAARNSV